MPAEKTTAKKTPKTAPKTAGTAAAPAPKGIDPRGPRFGAGITAVLLLITAFLGLTGLSAARGPVLPSDPASSLIDPDGWLITAAELGARAADPGFLLLALLALVFAWGAFAGIARHPYGLLFRALVRPRLQAPAHLEDPAPPTFAQLIGFVVTAVGVVLHLLGVPLAVPIAAGFAFVAAFLNSVFNYCLGCEIYLLLARAGLLGSVRAARPRFTPAGA